MIVQKNLRSLAEQPFARYRSHINHVMNAIRTWQSRRETTLRASARLLQVSPASNPSAVITKIRGNRDSPPHS
jgi:hypothetical protein